LKIEKLRIFRGRNIYSHKPCIRADIDLGEYWNTPTCDIPDFNNLLLEYIPTLKEHKCSRGYKGGFAERLYEGTYMAHVMEHICIELQNSLGYDVSFGKARKTDKDNIYYIVFEYKSELVAIELLYVTLNLVNDISSGIRKIDLNHKLAVLKEKVAKLNLGPSTLAIKEEAEKRGIPVLRLGRGSLLQLGYGKYSRRMEATITDNTGCISVDISCNKELTKELLATSGIPVPEGYLCYSLDDVIEYTSRLGYPVVIKPNDGNQGKGVSLNLKNEEDVITAFNIARTYSDEVILEKYIEGRHYRALIVNGRMIACAERIAAHVIGDGENSIRKLIEIENQNPLRGDGHEKPLTRIKIDSIIDLYLKKNKSNLDYVPEKGQAVYLRENDNLSTGGIAIDVTDEIHQDNADIAINAAKIVGLDIAGIDITTKDIRQPMINDNGVVIEVNSAPGIRMHHYPTKGKQRNVAKEVLDMLFPKGSKFSIPIISVTGTNGKTTTTRMIAKILQEKKYVVGMTTTSGIYINDKCIMKGDTTGPASAQALLMDKSVEAAVLETARGGLLNRGLGYDLADIGIITNITEDHLGIDGINTLEELAHVKALVAEAVKDTGYAVLNADDKYCAKIAKELKKKVILFSTKSNHLLIREQVKKGEKAVYLKKGKIFIFDGNIEHKFMDIKEIPATLNGILKYNVKNSLAAIAGAYGLGIEARYMKEALRKFKTDSKINPGRFNTYQIGDFTAVVDYGHNIEGYKEVIATLQNMKHNRVIAVIGVPGDRTETSTVKIGQLCGESFDHIIIKEDKDLRGRNPGEIARFLRNGCLIGGAGKERVEIELSEEKAFKKAMLMAKKDDIVVVFYEDYDGILKTIHEMEELIKERCNKNILKFNA